MEFSRTKIDRAGERLSKGVWKNDDEYLDFEVIFDEYRKIFIEPLTEVTLKLHSWLLLFKQEYYIAQRIKRKPQILRKLKRFSVRLTQLQDIGGLRIIFIGEKSFFKIIRETDYREKGRDDSGYRAVHLILSRNEVVLELQLRSQMQHNWAERIERTSVIYGHFLKELDGDKIVLDYFKLLSNIFHEIESGRKPSHEMIEDLEEIKIKSEEIIRNSDKKNIFNSHVNETFIKGMISRDAALTGKFYNWLIVFNWKEGCFESWQLVEGKSIDAIKSYKEPEKKWDEENGYEVVMIGSSDVSMIRKTHSHYFGIDNYDTILQSIDESILSFNKRSEFDHDARIVLQCLYRRGNWNTKKVSYDTLKNHYCREVKRFDSAIDILEKLGFITKTVYGKNYSLNVKKRKEIEKII